ncbi:MAG TPA: efflux RND transporter periplasmic adaptor subunit [Candidatus Wunengus sp. YC63]|uniref:efflux RND transporter periplasmic adaptor subunit n=1 Tax=Candidatus Wunengus sp. YC63 TaxID=3367699 RepID=UPI004025BC62
MTRIPILMLIIMMSCPVNASDNHGQKEAADQTMIEPSFARDMKIKVEAAGPGIVHQTINLAGKITLNKNRVAQVRARFPGIVRDVKSSIGDKVQKGQTLAVVESNDSLQTYPVKSPLDGIILGRNTNVGDTAGNDPIFVVADLTQLWAEFFIFSRDVSAVKPGQVIIIKSLNDDTTSETRLTTLLPTTESSSQTVVARVDIDNIDDKWRAGMTVRGEIILHEQEVPVAVRTSAIQLQEGNQVVYVRKDNIYTMRKVETGQSNRDWTEILSGLQPGETYVSENSFIIKADIAKSTSEHSH